jgi:hypothetical protein
MHVDHYSQFVTHTKKFELRMMDVDVNKTIHGSTAIVFGALCSEDACE